MVTKMLSVGCPDETYIHLQLHLALFLFFFAFPLAVCVVYFLSLVRSSSLSFIAQSAPMHQRDGGNLSGALKYLGSRQRNRFLLFLFVGEPNEREEKVSGKPWKERGAEGERPREKARGKRLRRATEERKKNKVWSAVLEASSVALRRPAGRPRPLSRRQLFPLPRLSGFGTRRIRSTLKRKSEIARRKKESQSILRRSYRAQV